MVEWTVIEDLVSQACKAPSSHNTQPWEFEANADEIRLYADRTRALNVNDPRDRELTISCGCALMNLRVATAAHGLPALISERPNLDDPDYLARVTFEHKTDKALTPLSSSISTRRTCRKNFDSNRVPDILTDLTDAAKTEGAWLEPVSGSNRMMAAELVLKGDATLWADPHWRKELARWMHPRRQGDGLTLPRLAIPIAKFVVRTFDMGKIVGKKNSEITRNAPLFLVLGTQKDRPIDWLRAGQALERVLLVAAKEGLQASFLNQPIQVAHLRPKLQRLCAQKGIPQILLGIGYPRKIPMPSPRRKIADILKRIN